MRDKKEKDYGNNLVEAKNDMVRAKMPYSAHEQKIAALVLSCIDPRDGKLKEYKFKTAELMKMLNLGRVYKQLYAITEAVRSKGIEIRPPDGRLIQVGLINKAEYNEDRSEVTFTVDEAVKTYLVNLDREYTKFYLSNVLGLSSKYSIAMYRFLKSFEVQKVVTKPLYEIRFSLAVESHEYYNFKDFRINVLEPAQRELEEKTDIRFTYTLGKRRKKVESITFTINFNPILDDKLKIAQQQVVLAAGELKRRQKVAEEVKRSLDEAEREARNRQGHLDNIPPLFEPPKNKGWEGE